MKRGFNGIKHGKTLRRGLFVVIFFEISAIVISFWTKLGASRLLPRYLARSPHSLNRDDVLLLLTLAHGWWRLFFFLLLKLFKLQLPCKLWPDSDCCPLVIFPFSAVLPGTLGWLSAANEFRLLPASLFHSPAARGSLPGFYLFIYLFIRCYNTGGQSKYVKTRMLQFSTSAQQPWGWPLGSGRGLSGYEKMAICAPGKINCHSTVFTGPRREVRSVVTAHLRVSYESRNHFNLQFWEI